MSYATEYIASALKAARESKGLNQRELSKETGVPQGHISKIENGAVDLRLSSLVALARALDLELTFVPRKAVPAVQSIVRSSERTNRKNSENSRQPLRGLKHLQDTIANLTKTISAPKELWQLQRQAFDLRHFQLTPSGLEAIRAANKAVKAFSIDTKNLDALRQSLSQLQSLRNTLAHSSVNLPQIETVRPAYRLDEDDDDHG